MKNSMKIGIGIFLGFITISLCIFCCILLVIAGGIPFYDRVLNISTPSVVMVKTTKEPLQIGSAAIYDNITVKLLEYEFTGAYKTDYDILQNPPEGSKYLWIHIYARNDGNNSIVSITPYEFSLSYRSNQIDSQIIFMERPGYNRLDNSNLLPGISHEGWIRFTVPYTAEAKQIIVMFKPYLEFSEIYFSWKLAP
jgi:hypothetical protein